MSHGKQFTLYSHHGGPNGWKVALLLEELGLTYETKFLDMQKGEIKGPEHVKLNPNGRIPTIIDHKNNDFTLWESDAILEYIAYTYDTEGKFSVKDPLEKYKALQWLFFQASGQGPYFGQAIWFKRYHPEKVPSAVERYENEIKRVFSVLESVLSKQDWLVGGKYTFVDLSFIPWHNLAVESALENFDTSKDYPALTKWAEKINSRPVVKRIFEQRAELLKAQA
ncbi:glutathione S-transferase [Phakopsora pachyrhizi]|uniref:glutathione transferase n=1 Tax=Phakopsora pachyrhizi TaxID=170000 RepID=A0AAV0BDC9_PHAPC|nr:glutathione S-transferase [Phakopsora pachyrhizi]CAH7684811.1 glutathione S-transferase [Phakopsora pachyrhizi]